MTISGHRSRQQMAQSLLHFVFLLSVFTFVDVRAQLDSCNLAVPPSFSSDYNGLACKNVWSTNNFILRYSLNQNTLSIILSAKYEKGWVGIGFSQYGRMVGSSAIVGWVNKTNDAANINSFFLNGTSPNEVIANKGNFAYVGGPSGSPRITVQNGNIYLAFRLYYSGIVTQKNLLFALSSSVPVNDQLAVHSSATTTSFDFTTGTSSFWDSSNLKRTHGSLAIFAWGVLIPIGSIVARYCRKWDPLWYYLHTIIQFVGFFIGLAAVVAGKLLFDKLHATFYSHRGIGFSVLAFAILQILAIFLRPSKESRKRKYWNWYHHWIGRLALLLAAVNIVIGLRIGGAGSSMKIGYGFVLAILLATVIILEILLRTGCLRRKNPVPAF